MNRVLCLAAIVIVFAGMSSCSFFRVVSRTKNKEEVKVADTARRVVVAPLPVPAAETRLNDSIIRVRQLVEALTPLWRRRLAFNTFSGKAKVHFDGPDGKEDFTAHIRIKKDNVIWVAITAAMGGLSVAKLYITPDSIFLVNYLRKEVTQMPLSQAAKILPAKLDFYSLQNMIIGEPLREGRITNATNLPDAWSLQVEDSNYIQRITYNKADSTMRTGNMQTRNLGGPQAMEEYESYELIDNRKISTGREIHILNGAKGYYFDMNFSRIEFDQPLDFPFSIPDNYEIKH